MFKWHKWDSFVMLKIIKACGICSTGNQSANQSTNQSCDGWGQLMLEALHETMGHGRIGLKLPQCEPSLHESHIDFSRPIFTTLTNASIYNLMKSPSETPKYTFLFNRPSISQTPWQNCCWGNISAIRWLQHTIVRLIEILQQHVNGNNSWLRTILKAYLQRSLLLTCVYFNPNMDE